MLEQTGNTAAAAGPVIQAALCEFDSEPDIFGEVPQQLKDLKNWVTWKIELREQKGVRKPTKPLYNPATNRYASSSDPSTWVSFEQAVSAISRFEGVGFVLSGTRFAGVDFDGCITDGKVEPYVLEILKWLNNPYCEYSPSGTGLHVFIECDPLPKNTKIKFTDSSREKYGIEFYHGATTARYLTVTGKKHSGSGIPKVEKIAFAHFLMAQIFDEKFKALWLGDLSRHGNDHSAADLALMGILGRLLDGNKAAMRTVFSRSQLGQRDKWQNREDYQDRTINKALGSIEPERFQLDSEPVKPVVQVAKTTPPEPKITPTDLRTDVNNQTSATTTKREAVTPYLKVKRGSEYTPRHQDWLWDNRIPRGTYSVFSGEPEKGKGVIAADLLARCTTGRAMPDGTANPFGEKPVNILILVAEDGKEEALIPRLISMGADLDRVFVLESVGLDKNKPETERQFNLETDLPLVRDLIVEHSIEFIVIDPVSSYLGGINMNKELEVRQVLQPVRDLADSLKKTILGILHFNKNINATAMNRTGGAMAMTGLPRANWCCVTDPENKEQYLMLQVKKNAGPKAKGLSYKIVEDFISVPNVEKPISVPKLVWGCETDKTADDVLLTIVDPELRGASRAKQFLERYLANGPMLSKNIFNAAEDEGINEASVKRARKHLGVRSFHRDGDLQWYMELPNGERRETDMFEQSESEPF